MTKIDYTLQHIRRTTLGEIHLEHFEQSVRLGTFRKLGVCIDGVSVSREELSSIFRAYKDLQKNDTLCVMMCGEESLEGILARKILQTKSSEMFTLELSYYDWGN